MDTTTAKEMEKLKFKQGKERQELITKYLERSNQVCLLFLFDATSSMKPRIELVKKQFEEMFASVKEIYGQVKIRAGVVAYRDFDRGDDHTEVLDFTGNFEKLRAFLSSIKAVGGGDAAEDVFTGLEKAISLSWVKNSTKLICHVADAPCHGSDFHKMGARGDDHLSGDPKNRNIKTLLKHLFESCRVTRYFFSHLNNSTVKMVEEFRKAAPEADWLQDDHVQNDEALKDFICDSIFSSVTLSRSTSGCVPHGKKRPVSKNYSIEQDEPDWSSLPVLNGTNCIHEMPKLDEFIEASEQPPLPVGRKFQTKLKIAPKPFSNEGMSRYPFYAMWLNAPAGQDARGKTIFEERKMVMKEFKYDCGFSEWTGEIDYTNISAYLLQAEVQTIASLMARQFNKDIKYLNCSSAKEIRFPQVRVVSVQHSPTKVKHYNMEQLLQAPDGSTLDFVRFTNNNGAIGKEGLKHPYSNTVHAFSHYTFEKTFGRLMVTDLQGCWCKSPAGKKQFTLSDPMIHSDHFFLQAPGNFGKKGSGAFFMSHKCNPVCQALGLFPIDNYEAVPTGAPTSSASSSISTTSTATIAPPAGGLNCVTEFGSHIK